MTILKVILKSLNIPILLQIIYVGNNIKKNVY